MSSKSFGISLLYGLQLMHNKGVGMATDFTFIPGTAPRFGPNACAGYKAVEHGGKERRQTSRIVQRAGKNTLGLLLASDGGRVHQTLPNGKTFDFNTEGLAHFGMVPDMLQDLNGVRQKVGG